MAIITEMRNKWKTFFFYFSKIYKLKQSPVQTDFFLKPDPKAEKIFICSYYPQKLFEALKVKLYIKSQQRMNVVARKTPYRVVQVFANILYNW